MNAIYYHGVPISTIARKTADPSKITVMGASVYASELFPALLRFSSADHFFLPKLSRPLQEEILARPDVQSHSKRITFLADNLKHTLLDPQILTFVSAGTYMRNMALLREDIGRHDSPITGVVHSLNYESFWQELVLDTLSTLDESDALFVSSSAGREVLIKQIGFVGELANREFGSKSLVYKPQLLQVPLGVDPDFFFPALRTELRQQGRNNNSIRDQDVVMLYFGRLSPTSKADLLPLIFAMSQRRDVFSTTVLIIAGDDTHHGFSSDLRAFAAATHCDTQIRFIPDASSDIKQQLFCAADIFIAPNDSVQETFGITLVEAMAAGLPVIASSWDGHKDIVVHGETGFLIPTVMPEFGNDFDRIQGSGAMLDDDLLARTTVIDMPSLIEAASALISDAALRLTYGHNGRRRVLNYYSWAQVVGKYEVHWEHLRNKARENASKYARKRPILSQRMMFSHYGTGTLTISNPIAITASGLAIKDDEDILKVVAQPSDIIVPALLRNILGLLTESATLSARQILSMITPPAARQPISEETILLSHIARLAKYGLVSI